MNFIEHNLNVKPITSGSVTIYRLDQKSGSEEHPLLDTLFINDGNIEELVELWLTNPGCEHHREWLEDKLRTSRTIKEEVNNVAYGVDLLYAAKSTSWDAELLQEINEFSNDIKEGNVNVLK